jgi:hypothetical protein
MMSIAPIPDEALRRLDGVPAVSVAATKPALPISDALLEVGRAEQEYNNAQIAENEARSALAAALRRIGAASQRLQAAQQGYDKSILQERRNRIDPAGGARVAG